MTGTGDHQEGARPSDAEVGRRLVEAPMELVGRFAAASNATLLVRLRDRDTRPLADLATDLGREPTPEDLPAEDLAVYKPRRGEAPLWDFPTGTLYRREVAAHLVSSALGWGLVPVTVARTDAPFGVGSVQRFVAHDPRSHYFTLLEEADPGIRPQLIAMVLFDLVIDNADRKAGHVLLADDEAGRRVQLVDHGVSFNVVRKLRTVAWDFAGQPVPAGLRADLDRFREALAGEFGARLTSLLRDTELRALTDRTVALLETERFPEPMGDYPYPWPLL